MSSSILKSPNSQRRSVGRVQFALPMDLRPVLLDYASGTDIRQYDELLISLRENASSEEQQITLLHNCCRVVGLLDQRMQRLVISLLNLQWVHGSQQLVQVYQQFVVELLAAHNYYTRIVLERLLGSFKAGLVGRTEPWNGLKPDEAEERAFSRVHETIARILKIVPMAAELLIEVASASYPYVIRNPLEHQVAVHNLLRICEQHPTLRPELLSLIISRTVTLDVQVPREVLEEVLDDSDDEEEMEVEGGGAGGSIFPMDDVTPSSQSVYSMRTAKTSASQQQGTPLAMATSLDVTMEQLLGFIQRFCEQDASPTNWQHHRQLYREMCIIFDKQLLLTHGSHHVQFIIFFMCSLRPPTLMEHFLGGLWQRVVQPGETAVARQSAACYVGSLLARARCVGPRLLRSMLAQMAEWCHAYVAAQPDSGECDVRQHPVFYTVCQSLFYVVAFRHADLVNTNKGLLWTQSLGLGKLVTSRLNPLKPCLPGVAQNFAAVTRTYQLAYCYTVLERNARSTLPCVNQNSGQQLTARLASFFPFDPYLLRRSGKYVSSSYREYEALEQPAAPATPRPATSDGEDEEETLSDMEEQEGPPCPAKSPGSLQRLVSPSSFTDMFSYGSSPGFKHV